MNLKRRLVRHIRVPIAERSLMLAPLVGIVAGLCAVTFHILCMVVSHLCLTTLAGYDQGGEGNLISWFSDTHGNLIPWLLIAVPTIGGLISGSLVYWFAPEAEGHGTDAAIDAYHNKRGVIRARVPIIKMVSAAVTLGTGGSGGREGPIAQISAGFGSLLATKLRLSDTDRRILLAAGLGAGVGAIFHAPLAGAIFAIEVLYRDPEFEAEALIPAFIATAVSYCVFSIAMLFIFDTHAFHPLFNIADGLDFDNPMLLFPLTALAVMMAVMSFVYVKCLDTVSHSFRRLNIPNTIKPAIGAFTTGLVAVVLYYAFSSPNGNVNAHDVLSVLSFGYGFLQKVLDPGNAQLVISVLLVVGLGKILTTSLTIGSGGSGGVFGPSMVIGGALGAVIGLVFAKLGIIEHREVVIFAILGMASFFAAAANTPVSTLIMVSEMTASYELLLPSMWVCALSYLVSRRWTLYSQQTINRLASPAHRGDFIVDVLEDLSVRQAMPQIRRMFTSVNLDMPLKEMTHLVTDTQQGCFPVVDMHGKYRGMFSLNDIRRVLYDADLAELAVAEDLIAIVDPLTLSTDLSSAISRFAESRFGELPVVEDNNIDHVIGMLRRQDVIAAYSSQLLAKQQTTSD